MRILLLFLFFLFLSALVIVSNENLHLKDKSELKKFATLYYSWIYSFGSNLVKTTAYVVKFDWIPDSDNLKINNSSSKG